MLTIEGHVQLTTIEIWAPRYSTGDVLIQKAKVREHNRVVFSRAKHLLGKEFYISKNKIKKYPKQDNGGKLVYVVPMGDLMEMTQERGW